MNTTYEQADLTATLEPIPNSTGDYCLRCERDLPCVCGRLPYVTLFVADGEDGMYVWRCNVCGLDLRDGPCELHSPKDVPGFDLIKCEATPSHERMWVVESDTFVPDYFGCPMCWAREAQGALDALRHASHGRWRRSRATLRLARVLKRLGVVRYFVTAHGSPCDGCIDITWRWSR